MKEEHFYKKSIKQSLESLKSSSQGISENQSQKRLEKYGKNTIKKKRKFHIIKAILNQFNSFLIYILIFAAAVSFFIGHFIDGFVIGAIVILNATIGFIQQFKAEKAIENLKKLIIPKIKVIRDGKRKEIDSRDIVPGDIIVIESGDKVPADCRIIEEENLKVNEAALTGESLPMSKSVEAIKKDVPLAKQKNMVFAGTQVMNGIAKALVINTGSQTIFGKIAENLQDIKEVKTPIEKRLDKFSKQIGVIILFVAVIIIVLGATKHFDLIEMFLTSVALAVSAIPEGLPAVLTLGFAISSIIMSKKNVVIRKLPAVEALGSVTTICTDKTGTLTEEKMVIKEFFANNQFFKKQNSDILLENKKIDLQTKKELRHLIETSVLCNGARFEKEGEKYSFMGDPTEIALVKAALDVGINKKELTDKNPSKEKLPFDSSRKMMSVLRTSNNKNIVYTKGAPIKIIEKSTHEFINGNLKKLSEQRKKELLQESKKLEEKALRVLGFASKQVETGEKISEEKLVFIGFAGMIDPPRKEVKKAIKECQDAGISVKMITGDSGITAKAIGEEIGITGKMLTELELEKMSDKELINKIDDVSIFARVTPEQKLRITKILQIKQEVVAITGDGVNDSLALKSADVGIAMGIRGTDVSREVSDIVLMDDNFASIVEGVKEGRRTYNNIKKFTKYLLAVNFSEIFLIMFAILLGFPLPLLPLQILWINLVSDSFPSLSLVFEKGRNVLKNSVKREKSILSGSWTFIIVAGLFTFFAKISVFLISYFGQDPINLTRTLVLTTIVVYELLFVYTVRSKLSLFKIGFFSNKWVNYAIILSFGLHLILLYTPLGNFFSLVPLAISDWLFILPFASSGLIIFEVRKLIINRKRK